MPVKSSIILFFSSTAVSLSSFDNGLLFIVGELIIAYVLPSRNLLSLSASDEDDFGVDGPEDLLIRLL
ncbi:hypothetical protein Tco_0987125 [Tanacetum coccineum]